MPRTTLAARWRNGIAEDARDALRAVRRHPGFGSTVVAMLAIGIGVNAAMFAIASAFLFKGFPLVEHNERIAYISSRGAFCCLSYPDYADWRDQATSFTGLDVVHGFPVTFNDTRGFPESFDATEVSSGTFRLTGNAPALGRDFEPADDSPGAARVAILSDGFWERRYGRDPRVIGDPIRVNGEAATIVGVMPRGFSFPQKQELWLNLVPTEDLMRRDNRSLWFAFGRLRDGVTFEAAQSELTTIGLRLEAEYPVTNRNQVAEVLTFNQFFIGANENLIYVSMWGAVVFVLLIVCANLANLLLARSIGRAREISVRIALGAGRDRLRRQLLLETVLLALAGGCGGWLLAGWIVAGYELAVIGPGVSPWRVLDFTLDASIALYVALVSIGTGITLGLAPASRLRELDINAALKDGSRGATHGKRARRLSGALVIGQVALAVVLLSGAGVMIRSLLNVTRADLGVSIADTLAASLNLPRSSYPSDAERITFYDELSRRLSSLPGAESVALTEILPTWGSIRVPYALDGAEALDETSLARISTIAISPGYFETLGATLLAGRAFADTDDAEAPGVAIVNQRFAAEHWPDASAIGQRLRLYGQAEPRWHTVVGVVSNIVQNDATRQTLSPVVYLPHRQHARAAMWVVVRTAMTPTSLAGSLRQVVRAIDADLPIRAGPVSAAERLAERYRDRELYVVLFVAFAALALLLASIGLYAVVECSVREHVQEFGVRMAVGASRADIRRLVLKLGLAPTGAGLLLGLGLSLLLTRLLQAELVAVAPTDPLAYALACIVLTLAAVLGCLIPARRATRVDPVVALRRG